MSSPRQEGPARQARADSLTLKQALENELAVALWVDARLVVERSTLDERKPRAAREALWPA